MPTERIRWVDPDPGIGSRDGLSRATAWASLNSALTEAYTESSNWVTDDVNYVINCVGTSPTADSTALTTTAPTMDATRNLVIQTPLADRGVNPWVWSTTRYRYSRSVNNNAMVLTNWAQWITVRGLQIENTTTGSSCGGVLVNTRANGRNLFEENIVRATVFAGTSNSHYALAQNSNLAGAVNICRNNLFIGWNNAGAGVGVRIGTTDAAGSEFIDNNTFINCGAGVWVNGPNAATKTIRVRNNIFDDCAEAISDTAGTKVTTAITNATDLVALGSGTGRVEQAFTFETPGSDYRLTTGDVGARTFGTDLTEDAGNPFATDYAQNARGSTWDIGAHQVTAGGIARSVFPFFLG